MENHYLWFRILFLIEICSVIPLGMADTFKLILNNETLALDSMSLSREMKMCMFVLSDKFSFEDFITVADDKV